MAKRRYFDDLPGVKAPRANFNLSHRVATTMSPGLLHPIDLVEVLPGDTWTVDSAQLVKLSVPFVRPIMDDVYLDTYSFFIPLRLCYNQLEDVFGNSNPSSYTETELASIPKFQAVANMPTPPGVHFENVPETGTVYDYLGMPTQTVLKDIVSDAGNAMDAYYSPLPARAFALVWNEYFRNQQVDQEVNVNLGSAVTASEKPNTDGWSPSNYGGELPPVRRYGDYFSTAMLAPQKGPAVKIPIAGTPLSTVNGVVVPSVSSYPYPIQLMSSTTDGATDGALYFSGSSKEIVKEVMGSLPSGETENFVNSNLVVGEPTDGTINALRTAFQLQKYLERDAFYGTRYREYLYASYGVVSQDARLQVPEFLGGTHNRLQISQIMSTANTDTVAQGQFSGQISSLSEKNLRFSKSIPEHGYILTVACIRYKHLYSQAVKKLWFRFDREDFYDKLFSNLGQKAIRYNELTGFDVGVSGSGLPRIFGYQENFAEYRTILDSVTGQMRPQSGNLGQYWSLADVYNKLPAVSDIAHEESNSFERVLTTLPEKQHPFIVDFNFRCSVARVVSPYSMPGFADHH